MSILESIKKFASSGTAIELDVVGETTRSQLSGTLLDVQDWGLVLETSEGIEFIRADEVLTVRLPKTNAPISTSSSEATYKTDQHPSSTSQKDQLQSVVPLRSVLKEPEEAGASSKTPESTAIAEIPDYIFDQFHAPVTISLPEPTFLVAKDDANTYNEVNKWKNKYDYAVKVKELSRIGQFLPSMIRLTDSLRRPDMCFLCGILAIKIDESAQARTLFNLALRGGIEQAGLGLAFLAAQTQDWERASKFLLRVIKHCADTDDAIRHETLLNLGRCLFRLPDKELKGLASIAQDCHTPQEKRTAAAIIALALRQRFPSAALNFLNNEIETAKLVASGSPVFDEVADLEIDRSSLGESTLFTSQPRPYLYGRITAVYPDRRFGFLTEDNTRRTYYFSFSQVEDADLRYKLDAHFTGQSVGFLRLATSDPNGKYEAAGDIRPKESSYLSDHDSPVAVRPQKGVFSAIPKGSSPYAKAKRFELDGDLDAAKREFVEEIKTRGQRRLSAVKDLASLHNRLGEFDEGLALLNKYRKEFSSTLPVDNIKSTILLRAKRYKQAANVFSELARQTTGPTRQNYVRQQAYCLAADHQFDEALLLLGNLKKGFASDRLTDSVIEKVKQFREHGFPTSAANETSDFNDFVELMGVSYGLSPLAKDLLNQCDFRRVDDRSRARGYFDEKDFVRLESQRDKLRGRVPKDRAEINLTLAALCKEAPEAAGDRSIVDFMRTSLWNLGEMALNEGYHRDTARCYFAEALSLRPISSIAEIYMTFLLTTYLTDLPASGELLSKDGNFRVSTVLHRFERDPLGWSRFQRDFPYYARVSDVAVRLLSRELGSKPRIENFIAQVQDLNQKLSDEEERCRIEQATLGAIAHTSLSVGSLQDVSKTLGECSQSSRFDLDKQRLTSLSRVTADLARYWQESDYIEREAKHGRLIRELATLAEEIRVSPTKLSVESLLPICSQIDKQLNITHQSFIASARPDFEVTNLFSNDYCVLREGCLSVKFEVYSKPGGAPVEALELIVKEEGGLRVEESTVSPEIFRSGERRVVEVKVRPSEAQIADQTFTSSVFLRYRTRSGQTEDSTSYSIPVRLSLADSFVEIPNPYAAYAGGRAVEKEDMFFGRADLISQIEEYVLKGPLGQCFVLYGQKRSGKTSVLNQVEQRILPPNLCVLLTIGAINTTAAEKSFVQLCLDAIEEKIVSQCGFRLDGWPAGPDIVDDPVRALRQAIVRTQAALIDQGWIEPRIVLLIDEFTYLFEYITENLLPPAFMRNWKAWLQLNSFSAVVVGQDSMPKFKQAYSNEFGVTYEKRITYLSEQEARLLAERPILLEGKSRYRGTKALERVVELTSGSPFYLQILCDRLIRYLNREKAPFITEADINNVVRELTLGDDRLPIERFDPLITAAGESVAEASRDTYLQLLFAIANASDQNTGADPNSLPHIEQRDYLLKDMHDRDVIEYDVAKRVKIRVGLFAEWLRASPSY